MCLNFWWHRGKSVLLANCSQEHSVPPPQPSPGNTETDGLCANRCVSALGWGVLMASAGFQGPGANEAMQSLLPTSFFLVDPDGPKFWFLNLPSLRNHLEWFWNYADARTRSKRSDFLELVIRVTVAIQMLSFQGITMATVWGLAAEMNSYPMSPSCLFGCMVFLSAVPWWSARPRWKRLGLRPGWMAWLCSDIGLSPEGRTCKYVSHPSQPKLLFLWLLRHPVRFENLPLKHV